MKNLSRLFIVAAVILSSQMASAKIANCFTERNVVRGQFILGIQDGLSFQQETEVINAIGHLGLSIVGNGKYILVEQANAGQLSLRQQKTILNGLESLLGKGLETVSCNGIVKAL